MRLIPLIGALVLALMSPAARAADGPVGIGFAQAEEGTFFCRDADPAKAFACALKQCRQAAGQQQCVATRWCSPAGWSGTMVGWLPEFHVTQVVCGTGGAEAVTAALQALCENTPEYSRCDMLSVIDPDGRVTQIDNVSWPGPLTKEPPPASTEPPPAE
ncbi:MAG: hypothetical protein J0H94_12410 [Rhizobiales bacterium]|nr:hypothetical protein [Hyphomicrobiales bacterium]